MEEKITSKCVYKNHVGSRVSFEFFNTTHFSGISTDIASSYELEFYVNVDYKRLIRQSRVFAAHVRQHSHLDFRKILGKESDWDKNLRDVYIYSFIKAMLFGLNSDTARSVPQESCLLLGHACLYHSLIKGQFTGQYFKNIAVTTKINKSREYCDRVLNLLKDNFSSIWNNSYYEEGTRDIIFKHPDLERYLNHLQFNAKKIVTVETISTSNVDQNIVYPHNSRPLGNCAFSCEMDRILYISQEDELLSSPSFCWNRACFITLKGDYFIGDNKVFQSLPNQEESDTFIRHDVHSIVGFPVSVGEIKPDYNSGLLSKLDYSYTLSCDDKNNNPKT